ncbi:MAG: glycogen synthase GlgA [Clostridiales bacterium]|nr:glycogen synthase GlgA [Clostridiales bacterium]
MAKKKILFVSSEAVPFVKTGGLADVAGTLPEYFDKRKYDVRVILPKYACLKNQENLEFLFHIDVRLSWRMQYAGVFRAQNNGITYYFIDNEFYFKTETPYGEARGDIEKFAFFCRAVLSVMPIIDFKPDIIHCHDWQASMIPVYLFDEFKNTEFYKNTKTIFTIHNLKFQGIYSKEIIEDVLGVSNSYFDNGTLQQHGNANLLKGALCLSDKITTVSASYAQEIKTDFYGEGLNDYIVKRQNDLIGIVNGIDYKTFDPKCDPLIYACYNKVNFLNKKINKKELQKEMGLPQNEDTMLLGIVSRLTDQKGFDLIDCVLDEILQKDIQLVVLGTGEKRYEDMFKFYQQKYPQKLKANIFYSEELSHKIYAGCDAFLMPSLFEPCGLSQLMSLRYGTLPIVRETGGLKDTVISFNEFEQTGTGFSFCNYNAHDMLNTISYALKVYEDKKQWNSMAKRAMSVDYSWKNSAKEYQVLYESL